MEKKTEEKGLAKIENGIIAKIRRFLVSIFKKKSYEKQDDKLENIEKIEEANEKEEKITQLREVSLEEYFDDNDEEVTNSESDTEKNAINKTEISDEKDECKTEKMEKEKNREELFKEKEELEKKLMSYYENIKKCTYMNKQ